MANHEEAEEMLSLPSIHGPPGKWQVAGTRSERNNRCKDCTTPKNFEHGLQASGKALVGLYTVYTC